MSTDRAARSVQLPPRRQTNVETAYVALHTMLSRGAVVAGDLLSESEIARQLQMSRTPVREAIGRLVQEGLVDTLPSRGVVVTSPTLSDVEEVYAIRELLEGLAARTAAVRAAPAEIKELEDLLSEMQRAVDADEDHVFSELDMLFHAEIAKVAGNRRLKQLLVTMRVANVLAYFRPAYDHHNPRSSRSLAEHRKIVEAIRERDPEAAESAMRDHFRDSMRDAVADAFATAEYSDKPRDGS